MKLPRLNPAYLPLLATALVLLGTYATGAMLLHEKQFVSPRVVTNLVHQNAVIGVAAIGATFVILSGGIDLSVGAVVACTAIGVAKLIALGVDPVLAWAIALAGGTLLGVTMGTLIHAFRLPAFMVTLAGMFFARAMAFQIETSNIGIAHPTYDTIQQFRLPLLPPASLTAIALVMLACYLLAMAISRWTPFGRYVYALGGDETSAQLLGVPAASTRIGVYALGGFCSALAGVLASLYKSSGDPAGFSGMELDAIAAVVIGGTLISGGVGFVAGTFLGVLIQGLIQTMIDFHGGISSWWTKIVVGLLVLGFIVLQNLLLRIGSRKVAT
jgi:simple sugar transport system permease protein